MDPKKFKSRMGDLALGSALGAAARDYKKEMEAQYKARSQPAAAVHEGVDVDDLMDDPELEKLHAERIASLKKEAEKRLALSRKGHGEYREVTEGEFLGEVTGGERLVCQFFHKEFVRCKIMDKHLLSLASTYFDTKFIKVDAEVMASDHSLQALYAVKRRRTLILFVVVVQNCPFFVTKLAVKVLPCVILFRNGVAIDRIVGFEELGGKDDFPRKALEARLLKKDIVVPKQQAERDVDEGPRNVRSSVYTGSDSD